MAQKPKILEDLSPSHDPTAISCLLHYGHPFSSSHSPFPFTHQKGRRHPSSSGSWPRVSPPSACLPSGRSAVRSRCPRACYPERDDTLLDFDHCNDSSSCPPASLPARLLPCQTTALAPLDSLCDALFNNVLLANLLHFSPTGKAQDSSSIHHSHIQPTLSHNTLRF